METGQNTIHFYPVFDLANARIASQIAHPLACKKQLVSYVNSRGKIL